MPEKVLEILIIIGIILFFGILIGVYIFKKIKHIPTGDCAYCAKRKNQMLKEYHKMYPKKDHNCPNCKYK